MKKGQNYAVWIVALSMSAAAAQAKMPPNSFLRYSANTQSQLIEQITKYPEVSDRYERHYSMTKAEVINYLKSLKLSKLKADGDFLVYNVPANSGVLRSRVLRLKKGTKVWVDWQGDFVLQWVCGNPMGRGPKPGPRGEVVADIVAAPADMAPIGIPVPGEAEGPIFAASSEPPTPTFVEALPVNPGLMAPVGSNAPFGLLLLPLLFLRPPGDDEPEPVPEPGTMLAMGAGVAAMIVGRRRIRVTN